MSLMLSGSKYGKNVSEKFKDRKSLVCAMAKQKNLKNQKLYSLDLEAWWPNGMELTFEKHEEVGISRLASSRHPLTRSRGFITLTCDPMVHAKWY